MILPVSDRNREKVMEIANQYDIMGLAGKQKTDYSVQMEAGIERSSRPSYPHAAFQMN